MAKSHLKLAAPTTVLGTVATPRRKSNAELRPREYLTEDEIERLRKAAGANRNGFRDAAMILVAFRHGMRASELVTLRWDAIDLDQGKVHCNRRKNGAPSVHPLAGIELRALRRLERESPESAFVFVSERGAPFTVGGYRRMVTRLGAKAGFTFPGSSAHAAACLRLQARQRRRRYAIIAALPRAQEHPAHRSIHRAGTGSL